MPIPADSPTIYLLLAVSAFVAGAINAVAGGGTLLTFPALLAVLSPEQANATSTVALLPGSLAGGWGYRAEVAASRRFVLQLLPVSLLGGTLGSLLLVWYPQVFGNLVPWLILTAAVLFLLQPAFSKLVKRKQAEHADPSSGTRWAVIGFQFLIAVYGGYFGAGIGILMLTALGFMNVGDIHRMNGVKTMLAAAINSASVVVFAAKDIIEWKYAAVMAVAAIGGGYVGARAARRLPARYVRWVVIVIGFGLAAWYFGKPDAPTPQTSGSSSAK